MRMLKKPISQLILVFACLMIVVQPSQACIIGMEFNPEDVDRAKIIIRGKPVAYENLTKPMATAKLTFEVEKLYKGEASEKIDVIWQNSTFGVPETLEEFERSYGESLVVGLIEFDTPIPMKAPSAAIFGLPKELQSYHKILQAPCAPPFMFSDKMPKNPAIAKALNKYGIK